METPVISAPRTRTAPRSLDLDSDYPEGPKVPDQRADSPTEALEQNDLPVDHAMVPPEILITAPVEEESVPIRPPSPDPVSLGQNDAPVDNAIAPEILITPDSDAVLEQVPPAEEESVPIRPPSPDPVSLGQNDNAIAPEELILPPAEGERVPEQLPKPRSKPKVQVGLLRNHFQFLQHYGGIFFRLQIEMQ